VPGDYVQVRPGEAFPADGTVLQGQTLVNEALLTGESHPVNKYEGEPLTGGSINLDQPVIMRIAATGKDTRVSVLGRLLQGAGSKRNAYRGMTERYAGWFVTAVLLIAVATGAWWFVQDSSRALGITLSVLVVSCPCAFSLASPTVIAAASRALLKHGIVMTRAGALERLAAIDHVVFDKTGTLTNGEPVIRNYVRNENQPLVDNETGLQIAAALERSSAHPVARAFRQHDNGLQVGAAANLPGGGVSGWIEGTHYRIGVHDSEAGENKSSRPRGPFTIWLEDDQDWLMGFELNDTIREGASNLIMELKEEGLSVSILSGDSDEAVRQVAGELAIEDFHARQTPELKLSKITALTASGSATLMIGDGVNDAPVLAAADASISVQGGSELANSAADFVLTGHSLELVAQARKMAIRAGRLVRQNLVWAAGYNLIMIPLAVAGSVQPWMAALGMSASSLLVVLNASRAGRT